MDNQLDFIVLQAAHVTQLTTSGVKSEWQVKKNITGDLLHTFPATVPDNLMVAILDFARDYELLAFNSGIKFQKDKQNEYLQAQIAELVGVNKEIAGENVRLASILENLLPES